MTSSLYAAADLYAAVKERAGAFAAFGAGADVDAAFDEAVSAAGYDYGFADVLPSITAADPTTVTCHDSAPLPTGAALAVAVRHAVTAEPGTVLAVPVAPTAGHARRRAQAVLEDPALAVPTHDGVLLDPPTHLLDALAAAGVSAADGEVLDRVQVKVRARFKPVVTVNRAKSAAGFVVLDPATSTLVARDLRTAGEARRAAVTLSREIPATDLPERELQVFKLAGREGGLPLISVRRTRLAQKVTVKAVFAAEKKPGATKTAGWLFAGVLPQ